MIGYTHNNRMQVQYSRVDVGARAQTLRAHDRDTFIIGRWSLFGTC